MLEVVLVAVSMTGLEITARLLGSVLHRVKLV